MATHNEIGILGELIAEKYLKSIGCRIINKNFLRTWGEIDLIVLAKDKTLVFVEVKTMRKNAFLKPEDNATYSKLEKVKRTAMFYVGENQKLISDKRGWRVDVVSILLPQNFSIASEVNMKKFVKKFSDYKLNHFENV